MVLGVLVAKFEGRWWCVFVNLAQDVSARSIFESTLFQSENNSCFLQKNVDTETEQALASPSRHRPPMALKLATISPQTCHKLATEQYLLRGAYAL